MQKSNKRQKTLIHIAKAQMGIDDATYREMLRNHCGAESSKNISYQAANRLLIHLQKCGFKMRPKSGPKKYGDLGLRPGMATPAQLRKIEAMWAEVCKAQNKRQALRHFLLKTVHVSDILFLTAGMAHNTIEAIKDIRDRKYARGEE